MPLAAGIGGRPRLANGPEVTMGRLRHLLSIVAALLAALVAWLERQRQSIGKSPKTETSDPARATGPNAATSVPPTRPTPGGSSPPASAAAAPARLVAPDSAREERASVTLSPADSPEASPAATAPVVTADASAEPAAPPPSARADDEPEPVGARAGSIAGDGTRDCPPDYPVKGNADSMIYHLPGQASYNNTIAEFCFAAAEDAEAAGYRAPKR